MIEVPNFSKKEAKECLEFYNQNQLFSSKIYTCSGSVDCYYNYTILLIYE